MSDPLTPKELERGRAWLEEYALALRALGLSEFAERTLRFDDLTGYWAERAERDRREGVTEN